MYLRRLIVSNPYQSPPYHDTIIDRISFITNFLFSYYQCVSDGQYLGNFVCYSDDLFPLYKKAGVTQSCDYYVTGISELSSGSKDQFVYPNPVNDVLNINTNNSYSETIRVEIYNSTGQLVMKEELDRGNKITSLNIIDFTEGIYLVNMYSSDRLIKTEKVIVTR